jgi:hypothetical protein
VVRSEVVQGEMRSGLRFLHMDSETEARLNGILKSLESDEIARLVDS